MDCSGGIFSKPGELAINADGISTGDNIFLRDNFIANGQVFLLGARISGDLDCTGGRFFNSANKALSADRAIIKGGVSLSNGFQAVGEVRFPSADIGGTLSCAGSMFLNPEKEALNADQVTVKSSVLLGKGFFADGKVLFSNANINGDFECNGGTILNQNQQALVVAQSKIKGSVLLGNDFCAFGEVLLVAASIDKILWCEGGRILNSGGKALIGDRLEVKGSVYLTKGFCAVGSVQFPSAVIGSNFRCINGIFRELKSSECALNLQGININNGFFWLDVTGNGELDLAYAKVSILEDDLPSWEPFKVNLHGFSYDYLNHPYDITSRLKWLNKSAGDTGFYPIVYEQAAKVLFKMGHDDDAKEILLENERLKTQNMDAGWQRRLRTSWDRFSGYGYRLGRTAKWMFYFVLLGSVIFWFAGHYKYIVPHQSIVLTNKQYQKSIKDGMHPIDATYNAVPNYPMFHPMIFSIDIFVPLFDLHQETFWSPYSKKLSFLPWPSQSFDESISTEFSEDGFFLWSWKRIKEIDFWGLILFFWYWLEIIMGWILTSLLIFSLTGLLRPRQSSSEKD